MKLIITLLLIALPLFAMADPGSVRGFHLDLSLSAHSEGTADPEIQNMDNPLGQVDAYYRFNERISVGVRHTSSIPRWEDGHGLNEAYIKLHVW